MIKLCSGAVLQAALYHGAFPQAAKLFLYRDLLGFANFSFKSGQRGMGRLAPSGPEETWRPLWRVLVVDAPETILTGAFAPDHGPIGWEEFITLMWDLRIGAYHAAFRQVVPLRAIHYEDLNRNRMFCGSWRAAVCPPGRCLRRLPGSPRCACG